MKRIIVEVKGRKAVVLNDQGSFESIANKGYSVGQEVELAENVISFTTLRRYIPAAAAAAVALVAGIGAYANFTPYSYVDIDINPSIELVSNMFDRVIGVTPLNEDARAVVGELDLNTKPIDQAVGEAVDKAADKGFIKEDISDAVMISVSSKKAEKIEEIGKRAEKAIENSSKASKVTGLYIQAVDSVVREEAHKKNVSAGKLQLIKRLQEIKPGTQIETAKNQPVAGIINQIKEAKVEKANRPAPSAFEPLQNKLEQRVKQKEAEKEKLQKEIQDRIAERKPQSAEKKVDEQDQQNGFQASIQPSTAPQTAPDFKTDVQRKRPQEGRKIQRHKPNFNRNENN